MLIKPSLINPGSHAIFSDNPALLEDSRTSTLPVDNTITIWMDRGLRGSLWVSSKIVSCDRKPVMYKLPKLWGSYHFHGRTDSFDTDIITTKNSSIVLLMSSYLHYAVYGVAHLVT